MTNKGKYFFGAIAAVLLACYTTICLASGMGDLGATFEQIAWNGRVSFIWLVFSLSFLAVSKRHTLVAFSRGVLFLLSLAVSLIIYWGINNFTFDVLQWRGNIPGVSLLTAPFLLIPAWPGLRFFEKTRPTEDVWKACIWYLAVLCLVIIVYVLGETVLRA